MSSGNKNNLTKIKMEAKNQSNLVDETPRHLMPTTDRGKRSDDRFDAILNCNKVKYHHKVLCNDRTNEVYFIAEQRKAYKNTKNAKARQLRLQVEVAKTINKTYKNHTAFNFKYNQHHSGCWYKECENPDLLAPKEKRVEKGITLYKKIGNKKEYDDYDDFVNKCIEDGMKKSRKNTYMTDTDLMINDSENDMLLIEKKNKNVWDDIHSLDEYKQYILNNFYLNFDYDEMSFDYDFGEGLKKYTIFNTEFMRYTDEMEEMNGDDDTESVDDNKKITITEVKKDTPKKEETLDIVDDSSDEEEEYVEEKSIVKTYENSFYEFMDKHIKYDKTKFMKHREMYRKYKNWCSENDKTGIKLKDVCLSLNKKGYNIMEHQKVGSIWRYLVINI
jgi:hypothetical protein